jgi:hypothetical protein
MHSRFRPGELHWAGVCELDVNSLGFPGQRTCQAGRGFPRPRVYEIDDNKNCSISNVAGPGLGGLGNPPQNSTDNSPALILAEHYSLIIPIFGFENVDGLITPEARDTQALFLVGHDDDLAV